MNHNFIKQEENKRKRTRKHCKYNKVSNETRQKLVDLVKISKKIKLIF